MEFKTGSVDSTLDDKGRVNIPVRFREQYQGKLFMTRGIEQCIYLMPSSTWDFFEKKIRNLEGLSHEESRFLENKHLNPEEIEIDKAGRIAIPSKLRKYASLSRECTVNGSADGYLSIWDSDTFDIYLGDEDVARAALNKIGSRNLFRAS